MRDQIHVRVEPATRIGLRALAAVRHTTMDAIAADILDGAVRDRLAADELARMVALNLDVAERESAS